MSAMGGKQTQRPESLCGGLLQLGSAVMAADCNDSADHRWHELVPHARSYGDDDKHGAIACNPRSLLVFDSATPTVVLKVLGIAKVSIQRARARSRLMSAMGGKLTLRHRLFASFVMATHCGAIINPMTMAEIVK